MDVVWRLWYFVELGWGGGSKIGILLEFWWFGVFLFVIING